MKETTIEKVSNSLYYIGMGLGVFFAISFSTATTKIIFEHSYDGLFYLKASGILILLTLSFVFLSFIVRDFNRERSKEADK